MIERLNDLQVILGAWKHRAFPEEWCTPETEANKVVEEMKELTEAFSTENPQLIAEEATDVIITTLLLINSLGYDAESMVMKKLDAIYRKYNPNLLEELVRGDYSWEEALDEVKRRWNGKS